MCTPRSPCKRAMANDGVHSDEVNIQVKVENDATMIPSRKRAPEANGGEVAEHGGDGHVPSTGSVLGSFEVVSMPGSSSGPPLAVVSQQLSREAAELVEYATGPSDGKKHWDWKSSFRERSSGKPRLRPKVAGCGTEQCWVRFASFRHP